MSSLPTEAKVWFAKIWLFDREIEMMAGHVKRVGTSSKVQEN